MANTTSTLTRADVLTAVVNGNFETLATPEAIEVASKMLASITKPRAKTASKASIENAKLAKAVYAVMQPEREYTTADIMNSVRGIMTTQKCAVVMAILIDAGRVEKHKTKKAIAYRLV